MRLTFDSGSPPAEKVVLDAVSSLDARGMRRRTAFDDRDLRIAGGQCSELGMGAH